MKNLYWSVVVSLSILSCSPPPIGDNGGKATDPTTEAVEKGKTAKYLLSISEVDNSVNVYVEDSLIFASGTIHSSPEVDFSIDFTDFIKDGSETLKIELFNGVEPFEPQVDPLWEIRYDLLINGEIVDFVHEFGDDNTIGKAFEIQYVIDEWANGPKD